MGQVYVSVEYNQRQPIHENRLFSGVASYGALGHVPLRLPTISFLVHFGVN